ncbi:hypothetical protein AB0P21_18650 [Kribbella sp. NPDC056861]|uniref:hypothetical protein n=1 Tax=Kribbella sp. NPDC056861 TaxID=3154857 RepID=UPI003421EB2D
MRGPRAGRALARISLALLTVAAATGLTVSSAQAGYVLLGRFESKSAPGWCLDSNDAGRVYLKPCEARNQYQTWRIEQIGSEAGHDLVAIWNAKSRRYLFIGSGGLGAALTPALQETRIVADGPNWRSVQLARHVNGSYYDCIRVLRTGDPGEVGLQKCDPGWWSQTWKLTD